MFNINVVSISLLVVGLVVLLVGVTYSSIRNTHNLIYLAVHNLTLVGNASYHLIIDDPTWLMKINVSCGDRPIIMWDHWYAFICHDSEIINEIEALENNFHQRAYDEMVIKVIYMVIFCVFCILSYITAKLHTRWYHPPRSNYEQL